MNRANNLMFIDKVIKHSCVAWGGREREYTFLIAVVEEDFFDRAALGAEDCKTMVTRLYINPLDKMVHCNCFYCLKHSITVIFRHV